MGDDTTTFLQELVEKWQTGFPELPKGSPSEVAYAEGYADAYYEMLAEASAARDKELS